MLTRKSLNPTRVKVKLPRKLLTKVNKPTPTLKVTRPKTTLKTVKKPTKVLKKVLKPVRTLPMKAKTTVKKTMLLLRRSKMRSTIFVHNLLKKMQRSLN